MPATIPTLSNSAKGFQPLPLVTRAATPKRQPIVPTLGRPPRVHLWHIGCQMNEADREALVEQFCDIGFVPEVPLEDADLTVLITCTVRQNAEQKVYGKFKELGPWKKARAGRAIAMTGCMAVEHGEALLDRLEGLDYIFDVREPEGFFARLQNLYGGDLDGPTIMPANDRLLAYVPVMGGCNEMCTYCIVPFVRGREQSRTIHEITEHVHRLVERGVREVTLLGQNVNNYLDPASGGGLPHLMEAVDRVPGLWRQRFLTSHPRNAVPELFEAMRDLPTACEQLHLPVQAGDDELLRRMKRLYTVNEYREKIEQAREAVPDMSLSTDIIAGFCGETDAEFAGTERLMRDIEFDVVHLAAYSVRPGTAAARREDDVPLVEKKKRLNHLLDLQREIATRRNLEWVGRDVEILVEGNAEDGRSYGRNRQGRLCWITGKAVAGEIITGKVRSSTAWQLDVEVAA